MRGEILRCAFAGPHGWRMRRLAPVAALAAALAGFASQAAGVQPVGQPPVAGATSAADRSPGAGPVPADAGEARKALAAIERERTDSAARLRAGEAECRRRVLVNDCLQRVREGERRRTQNLDDREAAARAVLREQRVRDDNRVRAGTAARGEDPGAEQRRRDAAAARWQRRLADHRAREERRAASEVRKAGEARAARARQAGREAGAARRRAQAGERQAQAAQRAARYERRLREAEHRNAERDRHAATRRDQALRRDAERRAAAAAAAGRQARAAAAGRGRGASQAPPALPPDPAAVSKD